MQPTEATLLRVCSHAADAEQQLQQKRLAHKCTSPAAAVFASARVQFSTQHLSARVSVSQCDVHSTVDSIALLSIAHVACRRRIVRTQAEASVRETLLLQLLLRLLQATDWWPDAFQAGSSCCNDPARHLTLTRACCAPLLSPSATPLSGFYTFARRRRRRRRLCCFRLLRFGATEDARRLAPCGPLLRRVTRLPHF